ncbi:hypothetical protein [Vibrio diabolicus]|uniref:hypothetical protein n=1 Tax=Vibrio diabolicus TaxID=50719 RepID=UPI00293F8E33|nr:hypothetical protein [Vibrio diabolicus]MDV5047532.1 hypothetical protein [Vibrio diabolicus]
MTDVDVVRFALEIFDTAISAGDKRCHGERFEPNETYELAEKLLSQKCSSLLPRSYNGMNSYICGRHTESERIEIEVLAYEMILPQLLNASDEFVPNANKFLIAPGRASKGWKHVPGYGRASDMFPEISGFKPWFGVFSDTVGTTLYFYYPINPKGIVEIKYLGVDLGGFKIYWRHGSSGLTKVLQIVYLEWLYRGLPK